MISQRARDSFDQMVRSGILASFVPAGAPAPEISLEADVPAHAAKRAVVLTVASYRFRLMMVIYFQDDAPTRRHFAQLARVQEQDFTDQAFLDAVAECGNMCSGTFNRDLGLVFPHLGMSTPNFIDRQSAHHLSGFGPGHLRHFAVTPESGPTLYLTLAVFEDDDLDFLLVKPQVQESTGELELF